MSEIIPVIHYLNNDQVIRNVDTCLSAGVNKVFLINHQSAFNTLAACAYRLRELYSSLWIGVNFLDLSTEEALSMSLPAVNGLWCDVSIPAENANAVRKFKGQFFGSLAFKYQKQVHTIEEEAQNAILYTDVATTSGVETGKAPTLTKIQNIRTLLGNHPMAIASGISKDNIESYKNIVDYFLVASSITDKNEVIDLNKLVELKSKID